MKQNRVIRNREYQSVRNAIFELLGASCRQCGFSDRRALQIDHVNGGGSAERLRTKKTGWSGYKFILEKIMTGSTDYQILCANCNWIKRCVNNEIVRHKD